MQITYIPQRTDRVIDYAIDGETITVTQDVQTDVIDLSGVAEGETVTPESILDPCPVLSARREGGVLHVTLLRPIGPRPTDEGEIDAWRQLWSE